MNRTIAKRAVFMCLCAVLTIAPMTGCSTQVVPVPQSVPGETVSAPPEQAFSLRSKGATPGEAVQQAFEHLKALEEPALLELLESYGIQYPYEGSQELTASIAREYLRKMDCEVLDVTQDESRARVKVQITSPNIGALVGQVMEKSISMVFSPAYIAKSSSITDADRAQMMLEIVRDAVLSELPLSEAEYLLEAEPEDGQWAFSYNVQDFAPLVGGVVEIIGMAK